MTGLCLPFRNPTRLLLASLAVVTLSSAPPPASAQQNPSATRHAAQLPSAPSSPVQIQQLYRNHNWAAVVRAVPLPARSTPPAAVPAADLLLLRALSLAQLQQLPAAAQTLRFAARAYPRDPRFPTELAGVLYRQRHFAVAARLLRRALPLTPPTSTDYARNFLATIDFLQGNLAAALNDWNPIHRPILADQRLDPQPALPPLLLDRIFPFAPGSVYTLRQYRRTQAQLALQPLFAATSFQMRPLPDSRFNLIVHTIPHPAWRTAPVANLLSTLRSLPYQAVDPEFWNLRHSALSFTTYLRWDAQKRMILASLAAPIHTPDQRLSLHLDARNENWDITHTLTPAPGVLHPASLNQERIALDASLDELFGARLLWQTDAGFSRRRFRAQIGLPADTAFFTTTAALHLGSSLRATLMDLPAHSFQLSATLAAQASHYFTAPLSRSARLTAALDSRWLPQAARSRLHTQARVGDTLGHIPFDELWMLGFDRDNPLWMRGHNGLLHGRKGNAPLGTRYLLGNLDFDRLLWRDPFVSLRVGPFVDTGRIAAATEAASPAASQTTPALFGSPLWLTDTGLQARVHLVTGSILILGWGHDLRSGSDTFYSAISH